MAIVIPDPVMQAAMSGMSGQVEFRPQPGNRPLPDAPIAGQGKTRWVPVTQLFWLNMSIGFTTPGVASEQRSAFSDQQNFPLYVRAGWTNMAATDVRARIVTSSTSANWSFNPILIGALAGRRTLAQPMLIYRRGYLLPAQSTLRGDFVNSPTAPEDGTSRLIWQCERPETQGVVPVQASVDYWIDVSLQLAGGATGTGTVVSQQIGEPVLIYGAITDAQPLTRIRITDTRKNMAWSSALLPIGCFAGIDDGTDVQQVIRYTKPYLLEPNSTLQVDWLNADNDTGKFIAFFGERILSQGSGVKEQPPPFPNAPAPPQQQPPQQQQPAPPQQQPRQRTYYNGPLSGDNDFTWRMTQAGWKWDNSARRWYKD